MFEVSHPIQLVGSGNATGTSSSNGTNSSASTVTLSADLFKSLLQRMDALENEVEKLKSLSVTRTKPAGRYSTFNQKRSIENYMDLALSLSGAWMSLLTWHINDCYCGIPYLVIL